LNFTLKIKRISENKFQLEKQKISTMNRISLLVVVCLVLGVCINMTTAQEDLSHIFSLLDTNNDMAIDKDEINMFAYTYLGNVDLSPYIEYFNQADQNGDDMIQFNEFETIYRMIPGLSNIFS